MPSTCKTKTKIADEVKQDNIVIDNAVTEFEKKVYVDKSKIDKLNEYLEKRFGASYVESKEFEDAINEIYGKKDAQTKLAVKIHAIAMGNRIYWDYIQDTIYINLPDNFKPKFINGQIPLDSLPESTLKIIYKKIAAWSQAGTGDWWGVGIVGKIMVQVGLPSTLAMTEATGAYYVFQKESKKYAAKLSGRINEFMYSPKHRKSKLDYGWDDIQKEVHELVKYLPMSLRKKIGNRKIERMMMRYFVLTTAGDSNDNTIIRYNEESGEYEVGLTYAPTGKHYDADKQEPIFAFKDYESLKTFQGGKWYLPLDKDTPSMKKLKDKMDNLRVKFRKLDNELFKYVQKDFKKSVDNILKAYEKTFGLDVDGLNYKLTGFYPRGMPVTDREAFVKKVEAALEGKEELFAKLKDIITGTAVLNPYWGEEGDEMRKNHFPIVYSVYRLPFLYEAMNAGYMQQIEELEIDYQVAKQEGNMMLGKKIRKEIKSRQKKFARNERLIDDMSEVVVDMNTDGQEIPVIQNQKMMKRMSNSINPLNMRVDSHAYYASLKTQMAAIERNNLIATMIFQINRAQSEPVRDMIINNFKVPFAFTDVKSGLGPMDFSTENITHRLGQVGIKVKPQIAAKWMRMIGAAMSGQMLQGFGTAIQNITAIQQTAYDYGARRTKDALFEYGGENGTTWREFIQRSGVLEFRDFFSKSLTNNIINETIERDVHNQIIGAILKYYGYKKKFGFFGKWTKKHQKNNEKAQEMLEKEIKDILLKSEAYLELSEVYLPTEERALGRAKLYKTDMIKAHISKYVEWAITKEYEFSPIVKEWSAKNFLPKIIGNSAGYAFKFVTNQIAKTPLTMSKGEELIRTVAFIVGVQKAQEIQIIPDVPVSELKGKDLETAIEIGRLYSHNSNFGLTPQDVGTLWWSEGGNLFGKFKIWSVQKFSKDLHAIKDGLTSLKDVDDLIREVEDPENKKQLRTWARMWKNAAAQLPKSLLPGGSKLLRSSNHELAQMRDFLLFQGTATFIIDLLMFGPLSLPFVRFVTNRFGLRSVGGMRSDLLGLFLFFPVLFSRIYLSDEDDDVKWSFMHLMRHSMVGYLPSKGIDWTWSLINTMVTNDEEDVQKIIHKTVDPITPFRGFIPTRDIIHRGVKGDWPYGF